MGNQSATRLRTRIAIAAAGRTMAAPTATTNAGSSTISEGGRCTDQSVCKHEVDGEHERGSVHGEVARSDGDRWRVGAERRQALGDEHETQSDGCGEEGALRGRACADESPVDGRLDARQRVHQQIDPHESEGDQRRIEASEAHHTTRCPAATRAILPRAAWTAMITSTSAARLAACAIVFVQIAPATV